MNVNDSERKIDPEPEYKEYRVTWAIDCSATSPKNAARFARGVQLVQTRATMEVYSKREPNPQEFDLDNDDLEENDGGS